MPHDINTLQRLSDEQVARRLATYGENGAFEAGMQLLWSEARDIIEATTRQFFGEDAVTCRLRFRGRGTGGFFCTFGRSRSFTALK